MLSSHTVGFQRPDNSNLANLTPGLACISSRTLSVPLGKFRIVHTKLAYMRMCTPMHNSLLRTSG